MKRDNISRGVDLFIDNNKVYNQLTGDNSEIYQKFQF